MEPRSGNVQLYSFIIYKEETFIRNIQDQDNIEYRAVMDVIDRYLLTSNSVYIVQIYKFQKPMQKIKPLSQSFPQTQL